MTCNVQNTAATEVHMNAQHAGPRLIRRGRHFLLLTRMKILSSTAAGVIMVCCHLEPEGSRKLFAQGRDLWPRDIRDRRRPRRDSAIGPTTDREAGGRSVERPRIAPDDQRRSRVELPAPSFPRPARYELDRPAQLHQHRARYEFRGCERDQ